MKKSIKKLQKHKKTIKRKSPHHKKKTRRYSKKYKGGNGDELPMPNPKRARYNPPVQDEEKTHVITFLNMAKNIHDKGPIISAISAPETVYALMVKILNLWNYAIQNIHNPINITMVRNLIDRLYNKLVTAFPQVLAWDEHENNAQFPIINYRSNAILEELFHYVANISNTNFSDVIIIPDFDYFNAPDRDNLEIVQLIQQNNHAEEE
uniref:Uncharacterized protein n=1 Tax=viral metagenome TaxID=1070528 RepID=A0A6C0DDE3_9ZZZZ